MNRTKIFHGNQYKGGFSVRMYARWQNFKRKTVEFLKLGLKGLVMAIFLAGSFYLGGYLNPVTQIKAVESVTEIDPQYPILNKIAKAESYNSQFCTKEIVAKSGCHKYEVGSVLIHINSNGTYDIGRYAINSIHLADASKLGYDVYKENDNFEFAKYLFRNQGSEPWSASKIIWNK